MENYVRAHIRLNSISDIKRFVEQLNSDGSINYYVFECADGSERLNARSVNKVTNMAADYSDEMYLVNLTVDGEFPSFINEYRI